MLLFIKYTSLVKDYEMNWDQGIEHITCFEELIRQEEKTALQSETSIERISALQSAIKSEERILFNRDTRCLLSLTILKHSTASISILASDFFTNNVIIPAMKNMMGATNNCLFEIKNATADQLPDDVDFSILPCEHPSEHYINEILLETELNLYASPDYLEKHGEPKKLEDLNKHTIIRAQRGDLSRFANIKYKPLFFKEEHLKTDTLTSLIAMAEQGTGIICFNDKAFELRKFKLEKINKLENTYKLPYVFNIHKRIKDNPITQQLQVAINNALH